MAVSEVNKSVGEKIRNFRKVRKLTLGSLSEAIHKSASTLSKYEKGEIPIDVETLYEIADALEVDVESLLLIRKRTSRIVTSSASPTLFGGIRRFYSYLFDGRNNSIMRSVFDVGAEISPGLNKIMMYMNFKDFGNYQMCETTYWGYMEHFDALTHISLTNEDSPIEKASVQILAAYLDSDLKWGLWNGLSSRPVMPIATKMLLSRNVLKEDDALTAKLKINRDDVRLLRLYNMFPVL